ncbi:hypothetical protein PG991_008528 [Apiospora marii]|uniref:Uncharacterized protein n=1 Tax=Apiospora marii TaxID=335849 RepID=A0ABR1RL27_9PEZI
MAPLTRRRAKEYAESAQTSPERSILSPGLGETNTMITVPAIAAGLKRKESVEGTPTKATSKGRKKTTPKEKLSVSVRDEENEDGSHHVSVEAHTVDAKPEEAPNSASVIDSQEHEKQDSDDEVEGQDSSIPYTPSAMLSQQLEEEASQKLKRDRMDLKAAKEAPTPAPKPKGSHVVFGDDDDVDKHVAAAAEKEAAKVKEAAPEDDEESDDDDEAPEAVSTSVATKAAKKSEREAAEAAEKQAADQKRKRQEKDKMMKEQAEKRKRTQLSRKEKKGAEESDEEDLEAEKAARRSTAQQKLDRHNLPDELPAEFLDSDSEDDSARKPKKIKFEDAVQSLKKEGGRPQDEVLGSTVYRVLADQGDKSQAPRMHHNARRMKEQLLRRGRAAGPTGKSKGFFKNKK